MLTCHLRAMLGVAGLLLLSRAGAQAPAPASDVERILSAVVGVRAEIAADARTARILGTQRAGSGIVIDGAGLVVTVGYLIMEASQVYVAVRPGSSDELPARILAYDHDSGLGLLRVEQELALTPMPLGSSLALLPGAPVIIAAAGGARLARPSLLVDRRVFAGYWEYLLEDALFVAPPHPLFAGAALISAAGELVGIGSLVVSDAAGPKSNTKGNMFIPVERLTAALGPLLANSHASARGGASNRPWLGLYTREIGGHLFVARVAEDSPALRAGVQPGEMLTHVDGRPVRTMEGFYRRLWKDRRPGDAVLLTLADAGGGTRELTLRGIDRHRWLRLEQ